jgi:hypothetical protein
MWEQPTGGGAVDKTDRDRVTNKTKLDKRTLGKLIYGRHVWVRKIIDNFILNSATKIRDRTATWRPRKEGSGEERLYRYVMRALHYRLRLRCRGACHHQNGRRHDTQQS